MTPQCTCGNEPSLTTTRLKRITIKYAGRPWTRIFHRQDLVGRSRQAHDTVAVQVALGVDISLGQLELVFGDEHRDVLRLRGRAACYALVMPSLARTRVSIAMSVPLALNAGPSHLVGQAFTKFQRDLGLIGQVVDDDRAVLAGKRAVDHRLAPGP